jgi:hypothetical protein
VFLHRVALQIGLHRIEVGIGFHLLGRLDVFEHFRASAFTSANELLLLIRIHRRAVEGLP